MDIELGLLLLLLLLVTLLEAGVLVVFEQERLPVLLLCVGQGQLIQYFACSLVVDYGGAAG